MGVWLNAFFTTFYAQKERRPQDNYWRTRGSLEMSDHDCHHVLKLETKVAHSLRSRWSDKIYRKLSKN